MFIKIFLAFVLIIGISILMTFLSESIPRRKIVKNLWIFDKPLTFDFKGVSFTVSIKNIYSDYVVDVFDVFINDEKVARSYKFKSLFISSTRIDHYGYRSEYEVKEILKQAIKTYWDNFSKEVETKYKERSYF